MKKLLLLALCLWGVMVFAQDEVTLVVSADGTTKTQAIDNALRSAIEQTFGTFVSANTQILNDDLVKDEIATVSSGNIRKYSEIAAVTLPNGNTSVTLNVTVSLAKLITYAQSKGSQCEFAGATLGANFRLYEFYKKNERIVIENMIRQLEALRPFYDYNLVVKDPVLNEDGKTARVSFTVEAINNDKTKMVYWIIKNTFNSLALTREQIEPLLTTGFSFQPYWFYFGAYNIGLNDNNCQLRYLYDTIPGEICDYLFSTFYDFKISDNTGGIFFCKIFSQRHKECFGNYIGYDHSDKMYDPFSKQSISNTFFESDKENDFFYLEAIHGINWIVVFTRNHSLISREISCNVPIEYINRINNILIEPSVENPGTKINISRYTRYSEIQCYYKPYSLTSTKNAIDSKNK